MKIGQFEIKTGACLAPMAGISDAIFRSICKEYGACLTCTEMISAAGLFYQPNKSRALITMEKGEGPYVVQIFGSHPKRIGQVAKKYFMNYDIIDVNMGCPAPKIVKGGAGCALMNTPEVAEEIIKQLKDTTGKVITCKIRSGWDQSSINAIPFAQKMQKAGAQAVTLHARTRTQFYSGKANWELIARLKQEIDIPVIGNGDISRPKDAKSMLEQTGCDGIMIGRAAQGRPYLFWQVKNYLDTGEILEKPSIKTIMHDAIRHAEGLNAIYGERNAVMMMRKHLAWYIKGEKNAADFRKLAVKVSTLKDIIIFTNMVFEQLTSLA